MVSFVIREGGGERKEGEGGMVSVEHAHIFFLPGKTHITGEGRAEGGEIRAERGGLRGKG